MELLVLVIGLVALALLSVRFGYDSRDGFAPSERGLGAAARSWSDPTYEAELAREMRELRQRRLAHSRVSTSWLLPSDRHYDHAA